MAEYSQEIEKAKDLVEKANTIVIVTHERPTFDSMGSATALALCLGAMGKKVTVACPDAITVELSSFIGVNKVISEMGKKNFIISLDYVEGPIEKVSYNIEGDKFNLVIEPREGYDGFSADKVHYSEAGAPPDLIIAIDTIHLGGLKKLYDTAKDLYTSKPIINVDRHPNNVHFGQVNLVNPQASSTAELIMGIIMTLGGIVTEDIATNLLNALYGATNNFQNPLISAQAFETAASCVRSGGKRFRRLTQQEEAPKMETAASHLPEQRPSAPDAVSNPLTPKMGIPSKPMEPHHAQRPQGQSNPAPTGQAHAPSSVQAPADWLKPKIFKSSSLL